ncbi:MAG: hypothetical protein KatS3mg085_614 [Candidatus Dojkabacteria bacterium]|nr:MAG: hypothetical protein KatS3mg085_614 [Candidatus Dojkabacteria bacterium]
MSSQKIKNYNKKYKSSIHDLENVHNFDTKIDILKQFVKFDFIEKEINYDIGELSIFLNSQCLFKYYYLYNSTASNFNYCLNKTIDELEKLLKKEQIHPSYTFLYFNISKEFFGDLTTIKLGFKMHEVFQEFKKQKGNIKIIFTLNFENSVSPLLLSFYESYNLDVHSGDTNYAFELIKSSHTSNNLETYRKSDTILHANFG